MTLLDEDQSPAASARAVEDTLQPILPRQPWRRALQSRLRHKVRISSRRHLQGRRLKGDG